MSKLGQYYLNEYEELGVLTDYAGGDVALIHWFKRDNRGNKELRYLPYLTPIDKSVADIIKAVE